jgi:TfoX/Sxy family transcriptional regulator of competence genes
MAHDPKHLQTILQKAAPPDLDLAFRPMFGGILAYVEGKPFASLFDGGLGLKLAGEDHAALLAVPGAAPLKYEANSPPSKTYVMVPDTMLDDPAALRAWIVRGAAGLKKIVKKPSRPRKGRATSH